MASFGISLLFWFDHQKLFVSSFFCPKKHQVLKISNEIYQKESYFFSFSRNHKTALKSFI
jgi:hypothetical protein